MNNSTHKNQRTGGNNSQAQTSDFMSFSNDPPQSPNNRFNPTNYSSPQKNYGQNRQWMNKNKYNNRSFNSSFNSSYNKSYNSNSGLNRSHNRSFNNSGHFKARQDHNNTFNKQLFLHSSFMEDPWAQLEAKLAQNNSFVQKDVMSNSTVDEED